MTRLTAQEIARRADGVVAGDAGATADVWAFDSRTLGAGACFVALRGSRDGHDFVVDALDAGASVALVERGFTGVEHLEPAHALVLVDDTLAALQRVAHSLREDRPDLHVVGVSGSTGKTSTKDLLAAALASRGVYANVESYNNEFGLPITLCNTPEVARVVVTEMGERFPGDLRTLCDIARPDTGIVTNVGLAHAEHLGGRDGVIAVFAELLDALPAHGTAVLNADDAATPGLAATTNAAVVTVGENAGADYRIEGVSTDDRLRPSFRLGGQRFDIPLHGRHQALNAAMAIAVANRVLDVPLDEIALELAHATPGRWRMELLESDGGVTVLNDAYNANPTSMEAALVALAHLELPSGARRFAVLGDMRELGEHHDDAHREIGERVTALAVDVVVGVGPGGAAIAQAARGAGSGDVHSVLDVNEAVRLVSALVRPGDAVLVKGSRALGLERVADGLLATTHAGARGAARHECAGGERP